MLGTADCGTVLVVDHDDESRLTAVRVATRLGLDACAVESAELLLERLDGVDPRVAVVEVELPGGVSGLEVMQELHGRYGASLPVILVSAERTDALDRTTGLMLGADDYLTKPVDGGELLARIRRSLRRTSSNDENGNGTADPVLSPREREILALLAEGRTHREIASALVLSPKTVSTHIQHVLAKLGVHSRAQAVAAAYRRGLVEPDVRGHVLDAVLSGAK